MVGKHESFFQLLLSLLIKSLGLWDPKLTLRGFFTLVGMLTNLRRLIFVSKNWPNDPRVGFFLLSNLIELIDAYASLEEEFKKHEDELELDEFVDMLFIIYNTIIKIRTLLS